MYTVKLPESLALKLRSDQRLAVERLAEKHEVSLGEAARVLIDAGIEVRGLKEKKLCKF